MQLRYIIFTILTVFFCCSTSYAVSNENIDKLTTYAVIIGRATACGIDTKEFGDKVGKWFDKTFTRKEQAIYIKVFEIGIYHSAQVQSDGQSPDSCYTIQKEVTRYNRQLR